MSKPGVTVEARGRSLMEGELSGRLAGLSIPRQVAVLAVWPFLEQLLGFLVGFVDLLISTRLGEECGGRTQVLEAMAIGGFMTWFLLILQYGVATGVGALVARATGKRDGALVRASVGQGLLTGFGAGVVALSLCAVLLPIFLTWFGLVGEVRELTRSYVGVMMWCCVPSGVMIALSAALRGSGDTRTPFGAMVVVNAVNIVMSWVLGFGTESLGLSGFLSFLPKEPLGVVGLAWGSVMGWTVGAVVLILLVKWQEKRNAGNDLAVEIRLSELPPQWGMIRRILRVAIPQCLEVTGMWLIHSVCVKMVASLAIAGAIGAMGAHIMVIRVESLSFLPGFAIGAAGATLAGQYLGAGSPERAMRAVKVCWWAGLLFMSGLGVIFIAFPEQLLGLISPGGGVEVQRAIPLMLICGLVQPFLATTIIMKSAMRGAGATKLVMTYSFAIMIAVRAIGLPVAVKFFGVGLVGIWWMLMLDTALQAVVFYWLYRKGDWLKEKV